MHLYTCIYNYKAGLAGQPVSVGASEQSTSASELGMF